MTKITYFLLASSFLIIHLVNGQDNSSIDCQIYNTFLNNDETMELLTNYSLDIHSNGVINLSPAKSELYDGVQGLLNLMDLPDGTSFQLKHNSRSQLNEKMTKMNYAQYYKNVKVEGGGYSIAYESEDEVNSYILPDEPCSTLSFIVPHIVSGIDISIEANIDRFELPGILNNFSSDLDANTINIEKNSELVIIQDRCQSKLAWSVEYFNHESKKAWIDAMDGKLLRTESLNMKFTNRNSEILDIENEGVRNSEINPTGPVSFYDLQGERGCVSTFFTAGITQEEILNEHEPVCLETTFNQDIILAANDVDCILQGYENLDIEFESMHLVLGCADRMGADFFAAQVLDGSNTDESFFTFGPTFSGSSMARTDVIGHEFGHAYLLDFFPYTGIGGRTMHEALADMFGVYTESICQNGIVDWEMGDETGRVVRDLANTENTCFESDISNTDPDNFSQHTRAEPLGHWFYLITEGDIGKNIPPLGIEKAIGIVNEAIPMFIPGDGQDFADIIRAIVVHEFGATSDEAIAVWNAFNAVCLGETYEDKFAYTISGNSKVCEEYNGLHLFVSNPMSNVRYRWNWPPEWSVTGVNQTSGFGNQLNVNNFPKYNYYPRNFEICAYAPQLGPDFRECVTVTLKDCQGDDPNCNDVFASSRLYSINSSKILDKNTNERSNKIEEIIRVYSLNGVLVYSGLVSEFPREFIYGQSVSLYIASYFDANNNWLRSEKMILNFE